MSAFTGTLAQRSAKGNPLKIPHIVGGLLAMFFLLLVMAIVLHRHSDPALTAIPASSLTALACLLTGFLMTVKYAIENTAVERQFQNRATWLLTITHLLGSLTLAVAASSLILAALPVMIAVTAECMKLTMGRSMLANLLNHESASAASNTPRLPAEFLLLGVEGDDSESEVCEEIEEDFASNCTQRISRFRVATGEALSGQVRAEFSAGEKTRVIHVAFCPPFTNRPMAEVFQVEGPAANIKQTLLEKFGMRLEIKLAGLPDGNTVRSEHGHKEPEDVIVEFLVESKKACA